MTSFSKSARERIRAPRVCTFASVKTGHATCLLSSNPGDLVLLNHFLGDYRHIGPTVKHDSYNNFWVILPAEFHFHKGARPNYRWRGKFLFLCEGFFWH